MTNPLTIHKSPTINTLATRKTPTTNSFKLILKSNVMLS